MDSRLSKQDLIDYFGRFGKVNEVLMVFRKNKDTAFSFVEFETKEPVRKVLENPTHALKDGCSLFCEKAVPKNKINRSINVTPVYGITEPLKISKSCNNLLVFPSASNTK